MADPSTMLMVGKFCAKQGIKHGGKYGGPKGAAVGGLVLGAGGVAVTAVAGSVIEDQLDGVLDNESTEDGTPIDVAEE